MEKSIMFKQDNGGVNRGTRYSGKKLIVEMTKGQAEYMVKKHTKWRTATKSYNSILDRFKNSSSHVYDYVILKMYEEGYGK